MKLFFATPTAVLFLVLALVGKTAQAATMNGYLMDIQCIELCREAEPSAGCTPDGSHSFYSPQSHTGWCLLLPRCEASGYTLMSEFPTQEDGRHEILMKLAGDASQNTTVEYIKAGTAGDFPKVTVTYDENLAETEIDEATGNEIILAYDAVISDPWESSEKLNGDPTSQAVCPDSTAPDIEANNMCFRSDIEVSSFESNGTSIIVIESSGCPTHENMQGSKGSE